MKRAGGGGKKKKAHPEEGDGPGSRGVEGRRVCKSVVGRPPSKDKKRKRKDGKRVDGGFQLHQKTGGLGKGHNEVSGTKIREAGTN